MFNSSMPVAIKEKLLKEYGVKCFYWTEEDMKSLYKFLLKKSKNNEVNTYYSIVSHGGNFCTIIKEYGFDPVLIYRETLKMGERVRASITLENTFFSIYRVLFETSYEDLPLLINIKSSVCNDIVKWRLSYGR